MNNKLKVIMIAMTIAAISGAITYPQISIQNSDKVLTGQIPFQIIIKNDHIMAKKGQTIPLEFEIIGNKDRPVDLKIAIIEATDNNIAQVSDDKQILPIGITTPFSQQELHLTSQDNLNKEFPKRSVETSLSVDNNMQEGSYAMAVVAFEEHEDGSGLGFATFFRLDVQN